MVPNKFFNDSSNTANGKPKFLPPQKRLQQQNESGEQTQEIQSKPVSKQVVNDKTIDSTDDYHKELVQKAQQISSQTQKYNNYNQLNGYKNNKFPSKQQYESHGFHSQGHQSHHHQSYSVDPTQTNHNGTSYVKQENQNNRFSAFGRNRASTQSNWVYRHLRSGHVDKEEEEEEKVLFESTKTSNPLLVENVGNYDHLKVDIINKFNLPMPEIHNDFKDLGLSKCLLDNIDRCGYQKLTIIQRNAIPIMSVRNNLMASSQTGSGKTASFLLPIIQNLLDSGPPKNDVSKEEFKKTRKCYPLAIIMAPTRELAIQIYEEARKFCHLTGILPKVVYGGKEAYNQQRYLSWNGCDILIATPGRLIDFMERIIDFSFVRFIVLDEADRMLDMGFEPQIKNVMDKCFEMTQDSDISIQIAMFSATFPKEVRSLAEKYLQKYVYIGIGSEGKSGSVSKTIQQVLVDVRQSTKNSVLFDQIKNLDGKILIFCATKRAVASVYTYLSAKNLFVANIHGDLSQKDRESELGLFKNKCSILIATDVASRGLDIPDVAYVINYDLPTNVESYIHRIGRTGRIGKSGVAISFIADLDEPMFNKLYNVLRDSNQQIPTWFSELVRSKYDKEERYVQQNRYQKATHHKWRGGYTNGGRGGYNNNNYGENRNYYNRGKDEEVVGYDSDYSRPQNYGSNKGNDDNFGYE